MLRIEVDVFSGRPDPVWRNAPCAATAANNAMAAGALTNPDRRTSGIVAATDLVLEPCC